MYKTLVYKKSSLRPTNLCSESKSQLFTASGKALQTCLNMYNPHISFTNLHIQFKQANPHQIVNYKLSLQLHKIFNDPDHIELAHFANQIISTLKSKKQINLRLVSTP
jgi:peptidase E